MTARTAVACGSLALALASAGCLSFYEVPIETPIRAKLDVTPFSRVLVAGFITGGSRSIDPNAETARLLRSQLRGKSELKIIDADVIGLVEVYDKQRSKPAPERPDAVRGIERPSFAASRRCADQGRCAADAAVRESRGHLRCDSSG